MAFLSFRYWFCRAYIYQFARHGNKARDRDGFGAAGEIDPGGGGEPRRIDGERFEALPQHLAALAERGGRDLLERPAVAGFRRLRGTSRTTDEVTLGCGTNAAGEMSNRILVSARQFASTAEPSIGLVILVRDDAFGHLALEHQHHHVVPGRPGLDREPVDQERGGDIVGQVGDDFGAARRRATAADRTLCASAQTISSRPGYRLAISSSGASARSSRSTAMTRLAPSASSARVSPPGPGPISITVASSSGPAARAIRAVRLRSSRKF